MHLGLVFTESNREKHLTLTQRTWASHNTTDFGKHFSYESLCFIPQVYVNLTNATDVTEGSQRAMEKEREEVTPVSLVCVLKKCTAV